MTARSAFGRLRRIQWFVAAGLFVIFVHFLPPGPKRPPPVPDKTLTLFYVGTHVFKAPANDSGVPLDMYADDDRAEIVFNLEYPYFDGWGDNPKFAADVGTPKIKDDVLTMFVLDDVTESNGFQILDLIKTGKAKAELSTGPYGLIELHDRDIKQTYFIPNYIGILDGMSIEITCVEPSVVLPNGMNDSECIGSYEYKDLVIEESFSVPNLAQWQLILRGSIYFLSSHEVK